MRKIKEQLEKTEGKAFTNKLKKHFILSPKDFEVRKRGMFGGGRRRQQGGMGMGMFGGRGGLGADFFGGDDEEDEVPEWKTRLIEELKKTS